MHIVTNKLVGGYVSEIAAEGGSTIIVIEDSDTTANRKFQNYRYVQSKGLTELGAAVHPYGVVIIPDSVKERATVGEIDLSKYHVEVNFNREVYAIALNALLALEIGDGIEFTKIGAGYVDGAVNAGIPPFYASLADKYLKINHTATGLEWADIPEELPDQTGASAGDVLTIGSEGLEWAEVPEELPDTTGASVGDVLKIGSDGLEWGAAGGLPSTASASAGDALILDANKEPTWGSAGKTLYRHHLRLPVFATGSFNMLIHADLITENSQPLTVANLESILEEKPVACSGCGYRLDDNNSAMIPSELKHSEGYGFLCEVSYVTANNPNSDLFQSKQFQPSQVSAAYTDTVTAIS